MSKGRYFKFQLSNIVNVSISSGYSYLDINLSAPDMQS